VAKSDLIESRFEAARFVAGYGLGLTAGLLHQYVPVIVGFVALFLLGWQGIVVGKRRGGVMLPWVSSFPLALLYPTTLLLACRVLVHRPSSSAEAE
jgi:hypothetical protein